MTRAALKPLLRAALLLPLAACGQPGDEIDYQTQGLETRPAKLYLDPTVLSRLQARAAKGEASWTALKARCDGYATGTFNAPNQAAYVNFPNVGSGYQGEEYLPAVMDLGLCYRVVSIVLA